MERLLLAFVFIGAALACSPVPEPKVKGKGHDIVYVTLVTNHTYNPAGVSTFLSDFSKTKIQQYSASVGNFSDLNCTNTDGYFSWTFKLTDANCSIVKAWVNQIVNSSSFYQYGETSCGNGDVTAYVVLITYQKYMPADVDYDLSYFNQTHIQPYSAYVGKFTDLNCTNVDGFFSYTFTLLNANCTNAKAWVWDIVYNGEDFLNGSVTCVHAGHPSIPWEPTMTNDPASPGTSTNNNLMEIKTPPTTTTTTATPLVIYPGGALPVAPVVIPYQSDYEETVEHVEESVSSFKSMSIMNL
uniref:Flo11 domain-containing protein n=1 Tax=Haemonchus contortus TaxID=6289 RepID=A0A7I4YFE3_HAECO|nr:unnamed protein product [Haemonchus contortus]